MSEKSLVLVVGAGASKEVNLPIGAELTSLIAQLLNYTNNHFGRLETGDQIIVDALRLISAATGTPNGNISSYLNTCRHISAAMPQASSIDNFINSHANNELIALCAKLGIARAILQAERNSTLYFDHRDTDRIDFQKIANTWFNSFFKLITENCRFEQLPDRLRKIGIVAFNYDRCIEHYLYYAIQNYYKVGPDDAKDVLNHLEIYHPYGTVGKLPWLDNQEPIGFGADIHPEKYIITSKQLRTFTEGVDPISSNIEQLRASLKQTRHIVFLGFAFHPLNIEILFGPSQEHYPYLHHIYATAIELSSNNRVEIVKSIQSKIGHAKEAIDLNPDVSCQKLFNEYWHTLRLP